MGNIDYVYTSFAFDKFVNNEAIPIRIEGYAISINGSAYPDFNMSQKLKISREKYQDILLNNGARIAEDDCCIFDEEDKAIAAVVALKLILGG